MLLKPVHNFEYQLLSELNIAFTKYRKRERRDLSRLATVRASSLPFCVRSYLVQASDPLSELDANGAYYTSVGTTVHTWVQDLAGVTGLILGNYYNKVTKKWRRFSLHPDPTDGNWEYHELRAEILGAVGHCDGVFCLSRSKAVKANKAKSEKKRIAAFVKYEVPLFVLDYKTCTIAAVGAKVNDSGTGYTMQLLMYCLHFANLGLNVKGYGNVYIPRDNPMRWNANGIPWTKKNRKYIEQQLTASVKLHKKAKSARKWSHFETLFALGPCDNQWCKVCKASNPIMVLKKAFKAGTWPVKKLLNGTGQ